MSIFKSAITRFSVAGYIDKIKPKDQRPFSFHSGGLGDVFSNETSSSFKYHSRKAGGVYLGIGSHQNFDHIIRLRPNQVVLVDVASKVVDQLAVFRSCFKIANNPFEFLCLVGSIMPIEEAKKIKVTNGTKLIQAINAHIFDTEKQLFDDPIGDRKTADANLAYAGKYMSGAEEFDILKSMVLLQCDPDNVSLIPSRLLLAKLFRQTFFNPQMGQINEWQAHQNTWLRSLSAYSFLHDLAINNGIAIVEGDIADHTLIASIRQSINETITAAYFSNVEKYLLFAGEYEGFQQGLKTLPWANNPLVLRTYSYIYNEKINLHTHRSSDPFHYQVLKGPLAGFFECETPSTEEELVINYLKLEAIKVLLKFGGSIATVRKFVADHAASYFKIMSELNSPRYAYLDIPALEAEYREEVRSL